MKYVSIGEVRQANVRAINATLGVTLTFMERDNPDVETLVSNLTKLSTNERLMLQLKAFFNGKTELAKKIELANKQIKQKRIDAFKKSVEEGSYNDFLSDLHWTDKTCLSVEMNLMRDKELLSEEEQKYFNIIEASIQADLEDNAEKFGYSSVEKWKKSQAELFQPIVEIKDKFLA